MKAAALCLVPLLLCAVASFSADEKPSLPTGEQKKLYAVYEKADESIVWCLENVERTEFFGLPCIAGKFVKTGSMFDGKRCYIPLDNVGSVVECDSVEALKELIDDDESPAAHALLPAF